MYDNGYTFFARNFDDYLRVMIQVCYRILCQEHIINICEPLHSTSASGYRDTDKCCAIICSSRNWNHVDFQHINIAMATSDLWATRTGCCAAVLLRDAIRTLTLACRCSYSFSLCFSFVYTCRVYLSWTGDRNSVVSYSRRRDVSAIAKPNVCWPMNESQNFAIW